jgi:pyruvate dehydrogenase E2 component (dihydrolipoamide acetyltransferase)
MEFRLPELGEGVTEGELIKWRVKVGDQVKDDQPLCEVMTDKATIEIPSHFTGTVKELVAKEGEIVKVHQLMLTAEAAGGTAAAGAAKGEAQSGQSERPTVATASTVQAVAPTKPAPSPGTSTSSSAAGATAAAAPSLAAPSTGMSARGGDVLASPSTRRFAREVGVDLGVVPASGPHGRVLREDVERASQGAGATTQQTRGPSVPAFTPGATPGDERTPIRGMRKKIAEKMHQSKTTAAHFTYVEECDATELVKLRTQAKAIAEKRGIKLTYLPFILKGMVAALRQHPKLNSLVDDNAHEIITKHTYNIGLSVQTEDGLTVPVIKHVEQKTVFQLAAEIADVVDRARRKKLTLEDFKDGTITLTNAGSIGGLFATPIINYPEVAILGFNKIARKPVVVNKNGVESIEIRDWTYFSISLDHRIVDGADAAEFMKTFISYIENPATMMLG